MSTSRHKPNLQVRVGATIDSLWGDVLRPWFAGLAAGALADVRPTVVLIPNPVVGTAIRARLAADRIPALNIRFWLPAELREHLRVRADLSVRVAQSDFLQAVLSTVAGEVAAERPEDPVARAVERSPSSLWETIEALEGGGWGMDTVPGSTMRLVAERYAARLAEHDITSARALDFRLARVLPEGTAPSLRALLLIGFGSQHWPVWPLLRTGVMQSERALICLGQVGVKGEEAEQVFRNSWEELTDDVAEVDAEAGPLAPLAAQFDRHGSVTEALDPVPANVMALAAENQIAEAKLVAHRAAELVAGGAESVAVLVPGPGVLAREVSLHLESLSVPHYTTLPPKQSVMSGTPSWAALMDLQGAPSVPALVAFLNLVPTLPAAVAEEVPAQLAQRLERFADDTLFSDLGVVADLLATGDKRAARVAQFIRDWPVWPAKASASTYLELAEQLCRRLDWGAVSATVRSWRTELRHIGRVELRREIFCRWFRLAAMELRPGRAPIQAHPYSRVHVMRPDEAVGRRWTHVIFAGQNEGIWPPPLRPGGYLTNADRERLNTAIRRLNTTGTREGRHGDGMVVVRPGHAYVVPPFHGRSLVYRDFVQVLEASEGVTLACSIEDATQAGQALHPGEFFVRAQYLLGRDATAREQLEQLAVESVRRIPMGMLEAPASKVDVAPMLTARAARQSDRMTEYDFCLLDRPDWDLQVSPSSWGVVLDRPAEVFLRSVLGVQAPREIGDRMPWSRVSGTWIHDWLSVAAKSRDGQAPEHWKPAVTAAAQAQRSALEAVLAARNLALPGWWLSLWHQACAKAEAMAENLEAGGVRGWVLSEGALPATTVKLPSGRTLSVAGRMDLLVTERRLNTAADLAGTRAWVLDFKSGRDRPLTAKSLARFDGVQIALYGLALLARGAKGVDLTIARADRDITRQISEMDLMAGIGAIEKLADIQYGGLFGWHGPVRNEFGAGVAYPTATLPVSCNLTQKFNVAHGLV